MSSRQYKAARARAYAEATKTGLWKKGEKQVQSKWYRKILWKLWRPFRKKWTEAIARWYRSNLKAWSHSIVAEKHDRDIMAFKAAQKKIQKERMKRQLKKAADAKAKAKTEGQT